MKSLCCWIIDDLIFQAWGFINALGADGLVESTGGGLNLPTSQSKQTSVICKMIPLERSLQSHQTQFPHVYIKTDKCPFQR